MDFDQIGVQHVAKRRRPSPLKNNKHQTASNDTIFDQKVRSRHGHSGQDSQFENPFRFIFGKNSSGKPKKADDRGILNQEVYKRKPSIRSAPVRGTGFSIPLSWLKPLAVVCGTLVIGVIGPNWDGISKWFASKSVSPESLQDHDTPLTNKASAEINFGGELPFRTDWPATVPNYTDVARDFDVPEEEVPLNLTKLFTSIDHIVRPGENVSRLANEYSVTMESIIALNDLKDASVLRVGRMVKIPNMNGIPYTVKKDDTISKIAEKEKIPENAILDANDLPSDMIYPGQVLFLPGARMNSSAYLAAIKRGTTEKLMINPVSGKLHITSSYGWRLDPVYPKSGVRRFHEGIDLRGAWGAPVKAVLSGVVDEIGNNRVLGNFIIINHNGYNSLYAHLSGFSVQKGDRVNQGQEIGKIGDTGYTTGSHLHFAVYDKNGNSVNPLGLLK